MRLILGVLIICSTNFINQVQDCKSQMIQTQQKSQFQDENDHQNQQNETKLQQIEQKNKQKEIRRKNQENEENSVSQSAKSEGAQLPKKQQTFIFLTLLNQLQKINDLVIFDMSVKKGRKQKFVTHMSNLQNIQKLFEKNISNLSQQEQSQGYEKLSIIYYNLAKLGDNQIALETAILLLEISKSSPFVVVRWRMQLVAMKSSSSHKGSYKVAFQTMKIIIKIIKDLSEKLVQSNPKISSYLRLVMKVINSENKNDFTWIYNHENNIKSFVDHIRQLILMQDEQVLTEKKNWQTLKSSSSNIKVEPLFPRFDFQIADYMSLQKLALDQITKYNQLSKIQQVVKQVVIFASICCFTQATETFYLGDYSLKFLHFKAIQIALLTVDKECTYIGFLLKILNDYYGTKMTEIRQENSELIEINQLKRKIPKDKKEVPMNKLCFAE